MHKEKKKKRPDSYPQCYFISSAAKNKIPLVQWMIFLHTADMPRQAAFIFLVVKFTPLFVIFLTLSIKNQCYHEKGQHRNAVSQILLVHAITLCGYLPVAVLPWFRNHSLVLKELEQVCSFSLPSPPHLLAWWFTSKSVHSLMSLKL